MSIKLTKYQHDIKRLSKFSGKDATTSQMKVSNAAIMFLKSIKAISKNDDGMTYSVSKDVSKISAEVMAEAVAKILKKGNNGKVPEIGGVRDTESSTTLESLSEQINEIVSQMKAIKIGVAESLIANRDSKSFLQTIMSDIHGPRLEREVSNLMKG